MPNNWISRRSFLSLPAVLPLAMHAYSQRADEHLFQYDYILGTSLDLAVWTPNAISAQRVHDAVLHEIERLAGILNTREPSSEIRRMEQFGSAPSRDLAKVLELYDLWQQRTNGILSIRPDGEGSARNVDALGKAYILDRAARTAREVAPNVEGLLLNIGGDMVTWGKPAAIAIADPASPYDNALPFARIAVRNCAIATSGSYARGAHLRDARDATVAVPGAASTVIAADAVTANAIATTMCISERDGFALLDRTAGAEALYLTAVRERRSTGFPALDRPIIRRVAFTPASWPVGYQMTLSLTLTNVASSRGGRGGGFGGRGGRGGGGGKRPYVAVWIENPEGKIVRILAFWASEPRYFSELSRFWSATGRNENTLHSVARATRAPGKYDLVWDGLDDKHNAVAAGTYRVIVETNQEHGSYGKQESTIDCGATPSSMTLSATTNFEAVTVEYGPKPSLV